MATLAYSNILVIRTKSVSAQGMLCRQPAAEGLIPALAEGLSGAGVSDIALQPLGDFILGGIEPFNMKGQLPRLHPL
jgi:hypothetical protein